MAWGGQTKNVDPDKGKGRQKDGLWGGQMKKVKDNKGTKDWDDQVREEQKKKW